MKYRVIGSNKDTGARMTLEMEADSKAAAERRALQSGMYVTRVEDAAVVREDVGAPRRVSRGTGCARAQGGAAPAVVPAGTSP